MTAIPAPGAHFVKWTEGGADLSTDMAIKVTAGAEGRTFTAVFAPDADDSILIRAAAYDPAMGSVLINGFPSPYSAKAGDELTFTAEAAWGYYFTGWYGGEAGAQNPYTLTADKDLTLFACFEKGIQSDLHFEQTNVDCYIGQQYYTQTATAKSSQGAITYSVLPQRVSFDKSYPNAYVDPNTGKVLLCIKSTVTVKATQAAWGTYAESYAYYTLNILRNPTTVEVSFAKTASFTSGMETEQLAVKIYATDVRYVDLFFVAYDANGKMLKVILDSNVATKNGYLYYTPSRAFMPEGTARISVMVVDGTNLAPLCTSAAAEIHT